MSIAAYATAVRNHLRSNLNNFYDGDVTSIVANCKVMPDEHPTASCGQEFISIYANYHVGRDFMQGIEEELGLVVAVSRKIAWVPPDYRGEKGYLDTHSLIIEDTDEELNFERAWSSTEARCREIVKLVVGEDRYELMVAANALLNSGSPFTEPLKWQRSDAAPRQVSADFFISYYEPIQDSDPFFGLVQKVYFGGAKRLQPIGDLDV
jgi:hypothetical protein